MPGLQGPRNGDTSSEELWVGFVGRKHGFNLPSNRLWHSPHSPCWLLGSLTGNILTVIISYFMVFGMKKLSENQKMVNNLDWNVIETKNMVTQAEVSTEGLGKGLTEHLFDVRWPGKSNEWMSGFPGPWKWKNTAVPRDLVRQRSCGNANLLT